MKYLKDLIKENNHKLVLYNETKVGFIYNSVFNYIQKYGETFDGFKYYNDFVVEVGKDFTKDYYIMYNIGTSKYLVNYHNGEKFYNDGSKFYDIVIFKNKQKLNAFIKDLEKQGYQKR